MVIAVTLFNNTNTRTEDRGPPIASGAACYFYEQFPERPNP